MKLTLTEKQANDLAFDEGDVEGLKLVENGDWIDDGKYSNRYIIFTDGAKFYQLGQSRSGSYFSDYYYNFHSLECLEVKKVQVITEQWEAVE